MVIMSELDLKKRNRARHNRRNYLNAVGMRLLGMIDTMTCLHINEENLWNTYQTSSETIDIEEDNKEGYVNRIHRNII